MTIPYPKKKSQEYKDITHAYIKVH